MADDFSNIKTTLEAAVIMEADAKKIRHCVADAGDLVKSDFTVFELVDAFEQDHPFFLFEVDDDAKRRISVGPYLDRIYGSIIFTIYSPSGQANTGGAAITDLIYDKFQATRVSDIVLRNVRNIGKYNLEGWNTKVLQVSFEKNVSK